MISVDMSDLPPGWRMARFDELLERIDRKVMIDNSMSYDLVGVRWYGEGAFVREQRLGMDIARKQQWVIRQGDVVYNKLFAWKGAFAVADASVDGRFVSDKFPTYKADASAIDSQFLALYFRTDHLAKSAERMSKGAAAISKLTLNPPQFWHLTIPLPSLPEQQRIAAKVEALVEKIEASKRLRFAANLETSSLFAAVVNGMVPETEVGGRLEDVLMSKPRNGWSPRCNNADSGTAVLSLSAVTGFRYRNHEFKRTSEQTDTNAHYWLSKGDLLITRSNTPDLVGHAAIYDGTPTPCIYPDLMMRLQVDETKADARFVHLWLQGSAVRDFIQENAKGTSPTMRKINQPIVGAIPFPSSLSLYVQRRILDKMGELQLKLESVKGAQQQSRGDLDELLRAVLDRAFRGEL